MGIRSGSVVVAAAALLLATSCAGGREARDFGGRWTALNRYAMSSEAIPLDPPQVFQATPLDGTLRSLLVRWAHDAGRRLDYRHRYDYTLHQPVETVHAYSLEDAVAQLGEAFAGHGVLIRIEDGTLVVSRD